MSWGLSGIEFDPDDPDALDVKLKEHLNAYSGEHVPFMQQQVDLALSLVKEIALSGVVGTGKKFILNLSGHANEDHEPKPGWANDCMTIYIGQK